MNGIRVGRLDPAEFLSTRDAGEARPTREAQH